MVWSQTVSSEVPLPAPWNEPLHMPPRISTTSPAVTKPAFCVSVQEPEPQFVSFVVIVSVSESKLFEAIVW